MTGSLLVAESFIQISGVSGLSEATPLASAKALSAFWAFSPSLPSISPGENEARSKRTCAFTVTASILSAAGGFEPNSALLIAAVSTPAPAAGSTSQPERTAEMNRRIIRQASDNGPKDNEFWADKFLACETQGGKLGHPPGHAGECRADKNCSVDRCTAGFSTRRVASLRLWALLISAMWVSACGKLPVWRNRSGSYSSANSPRSLATATTRSNSASALAIAPAST